MLLKPRFGIRMCSGIWPPSKPKTETPERLFWPFWPRPAVLPRPEPMPRPTRTRLLRAPLLSLISFSFMSCTRFRFCRACSRGNGLGGLFDLQQVMHLLDLAEHFGSALHFNGAVQLVEAEANQRRPLRLVAADRRSGLG